MSTPKPFYPSPLSPWVVVLLLLVGCSGSSGFSDTELDLISRVQAASGIVRHQGVRRVESHYNLDGTGEALIYREEIQTDGQGRYLIIPQGAVRGGLADPDAFFALQLVRRGFNHRYRDFQVRDLDAFLTNYELRSSSGAVQVAGRDCLQLDIARRDGSSSYEVALDLGTGLALRYRQFDRTGRLYSMMEYESYDGSPDLSGVVFQEPAQQELPLSVDSELGFEPLAPKLLPDSTFTLLEASRVFEPSSEGTFAKLTYTDGVETVFFIDGGLSAPVYPGLDSTDGSGPTATGPTQGQAVRAADEVRVFHEGPLTVVWGSVSGHWVFLVGKVTQAELIGMLTSSLP